MSLVMAAVEVAWALLCSTTFPQTETYLVLFYAGLLVASVVFFVPGVVESRPRPAVGEEVAETKR